MFCDLSYAFGRVLFICFFFFFSAARYFVVRVFIILLKTEVLTISLLRFFSIIRLNDTKGIGS